MAADTPFYPITQPSSFNSCDMSTKRTSRREKIKIKTTRGKNGKKERKKVGILAANYVPTTLPASALPRHLVPDHCHFPVPSIWGKANRPAKNKGEGDRNQVSRSDHELANPTCTVSQHPKDHRYPTRAFPPVVGFCTVFITWTSLHTTHRYSTLLGILKYSTIPERHSGQLVIAEIGISFKRYLYLTYFHLSVVHGQPETPPVIWQTGTEPEQFDCVSHSPCK